MSRIHRAIGLASLASMAASAASAAPVLYTSKTAFLSALSSSSTETFDTLPSSSYGAPGSLSIGGLLIQTTGPLFSQKQNYYNSGTFLSAQQTNPTNVSFSFAAANGFGFDYSDAVPGVLTVNGTSFTFAKSGFPVLSFVGVIDDSAFSRAGISLQGNGIDFDNVVTGALASAAAVPEPMTWAMLLIGFGMTGTAVRYRRPAGTRHA